MSAKPSVKGQDAKPAVKAPRPFRERDHRFTKLPVKDVLKIGMDSKGIKNPDMAKALGYPAPNVIAMMKTGSMRLPVTKAAQVAEMIGADPVFFFGKVMAENDPALWDSINGVLSSRLVSESELALINVIRTALDGHDLNLTEHEAVMQALLPAIASVLKPIKAKTKSTLDRLNGVNKTPAATHE